MICVHSIILSFALFCSTIHKTSFVIHTHLTLSAVKASFCLSKCWALVQRELPSVSSDMNTTLTGVTVKEDPQAS